MMFLTRLAFLCSFCLCITSPAWADSCMFIMEFGSGRVLKNEGDCERRSSPASTFKIPLSLMGFDTGILKSEGTPAWSYKPEYASWNTAWKKTTTPRSWLQDSVLWYSQVLTNELGAERFQNYVDKFAYGNRDVSGDKGQDNGLTRSWLSASSLQISPSEQILFLDRLLKRKLPVSQEAHEKTRAIMPIFLLPGGLTVYGKTGTGFQTLRDGTFDRSKQFGWFVGWAVMKNKRTFLFAHLIRDERKEDSVAGFRARDALLSELTALFKE